MAPTIKRVLTQWNPTASALPAVVFWTLILRKRKRPKPRFFKVSRISQQSWTIVSQSSSQACLPTYKGVEATLKVGGLLLCSWDRAAYLFNRVIRRVRYKIAMLNNNTSPPQRTTVSARGYQTVYTWTSSSFSITLYIRLHAICTANPTGDNTRLCWTR